MEEEEEDRITEPRFTIGMQLYTIGMKLEWPNPV